ncbi:GIY-YIG nuclease family protein [Flavobacterium nakdongensis]|uniref:GIY-YIG nuclease family protein n=1 Tax=Flavobacterium nakdongensis TaxID=3073563 RepID=UPI0038CD0FC6
MKDTFYNGFTSNLEERLIRHNQNNKGFTGNFNDWTIVYTENYSSKEESVKRETNQILEKSKNFEFLELSFNG